MKGKREFPIFNSHLDFAHQKWEKLAFDGACAIDATCGNGRDTAVLAELFSDVIAIDIQMDAIEKTCMEIGESVSYYCQCHSSFPEEVYEKPISLIVYNLGYLPGGKKEITTKTSTTLISVQKGLQLLIPGGMMSITCYPGHPEGAKEETELLKLAKELDPEEWSVTHLVWINRNKAPSLLLLQKNKC